MLLGRPLANLGALRGIMYDFERAGDILPKHNHTENNAHITIVARGKIKAYSHDWELEASAGQLLDFRPGEPHEILALEDNTRIFNLVKNPDSNTPAWGDDNFKIPQSQIPVTEL